MNYKEINEENYYTKNVYRLTLIPNKDMPEELKESYLYDPFFDWWIYNYDWSKND